MDSVDPKTYLTFGPWIYLVPQYKPYSVLILGYGQGTVAGYIRMFYDDVRITGVDKKYTKADDLWGGNSALIHMDVREYFHIFRCMKFDCLIIDLWEDYVPCPFIFEIDFVEQVFPKCNYLILHATDQDDISTYTKYGYKLRTIEFSYHRFHYFIVGDCSRLPVRW